MLNIFAPFNTLGYGIHSCNMIKALKDLGVEVSLSSIGQPQPSSYYKEYLIEGGIDKNYPSLHIFHDEYAHQMCGVDTIAFSVFETTRLSDKALWNLNHVVDDVFTTTKEHKRILELNGVIKPIHVVHEGVDPELYNTKGDKYIDTGKPTYITVGKCEERKNTDMIIRSFVETMQYKKCALIAHTYNVFTKKFTCDDFESYFEQMSFYRTQRDNYIKWSNGICDIYFTYPIQDIKIMKSLYLSANIGIAYSRAEGWDLPLMEMLACGIPTIASNVIGHSEYLPGSPDIQQKLIVEPIGKELAQDGVWFHGNKGDWYTMDDENLNEKLEETFDNIDIYTNPNVELSKYYHTNYNWTLPALKIRKILEV